MRTIWKFQIDLANHDAIVCGTPVYRFEFPVGSVVLDVQLQHGMPTFWVDLFDQNESNVQRFAVVGTGREVPFYVRDWEGTWQQDGFVWHLYSVDENAYQAALKAGVS